MSYGFPSGGELRKQILGLRLLLKTIGDIGWRGLGTFRDPHQLTGAGEFVAQAQGFAHALLSPDNPKDGILPQQMERFLGEFNDSQQPSIDAFLGHRPEFIDIGKAVIAYCLISCERDDKLLVEDVGSSWYVHLLKQMDESFDDFDVNQLAVITYNYDRSLEHFLFRVLKSRYGKSDGDVAKKLAGIPIVHVHGQLGFLEWQEREPGITRGYEPTPSKVAVRAAASGIKIISEGIDDTPELSKACGLLLGAQHIHFLGFGYNPTNMRRLMWPLKDGHGNYGNAGRTIHGTCKGFTDEERQILVADYQGLWCGNSDILDYLRSDMSFLRSTR